MFCKFHFTTPTRQLINAKWQQALREGELQVLKRITALQRLAETAKISPEVIAEQLGVARSTIYRWLADFLQKGVASFVFKSSSGRPAKLSPAQQNQLVGLLEKGPQACGYSQAIWTSALIVELIYREFSQTFKASYLPQLLKKLGFSYQKARFVSDHLDTDRREHYLKEEWPAILKEAQEKQALLLFGDEASFAQWGTLGYTWAKRGSQPTVPTTGVRRAFKVWGLVDYLTGQLFWQGQTGRFNAENYIGFLQKVLDQTSGPVIIIQDGAPYHTAKLTRAFIEQNKERLTVYQLPAYSPDFNPIEKVWRLVKRGATHLHYFADFEQLEGTVTNELTMLSNKKERVKQTLGYVSQAELAPALAQAA